MNFSVRLLIFFFLSSTQHQILTYADKKMRYVTPWCLFQEVLVAQTKKKCNLLGLDVGSKYVGLSLLDMSDKYKCVWPLSILVRKNKNIDLMATDFQDLVSNNSVHGFVVGKPFDRFSNCHIHTPRIDDFIDELSKTGKLDGVPYTYWDETFKSESVEFFLRPLKLHPLLANDIRGSFAMFVAVEILQGYMNYFNKVNKMHNKMHYFNKVNKMHNKMQRSSK